MIGTEGTCADCGLLVRIGNTSHVSKRFCEGEDLAKRWNCPYHCRPLEEDGESLSPDLLLLLKVNELGQRRPMTPSKSAPLGTVSLTDSVKETW